MRIHDLCVKPLQVSSQYIINPTFRCAGLGKEYALLLASRGAKIVGEFKFTGCCLETVLYYELVALHVRAWLNLNYYVEQLN